MTKRGVEAERAAGDLSRKLMRSRTYSRTMSANDWRPKQKLLQGSTQDWTSLNFRETQGC